MAICSSGSAEAATYKCVEDGIVTYQGTPCKGAGAAINVVPPDDAATAASSKGTPTDPSAIAAKFDEQAKKLELERRLRDIDYETPKLEEEIAAYQTEMKTELEALQQKKDFWKRQLGGKTQEQAVSDEMQSVSEKYQAKIKTVQDDLARLNNEKASLNTQLSASQKPESKNQGIHNY